MAASLPKQYLVVAGQPLIFHTLRALCACAELVSVHVVLAPTDPYWDDHASLWVSLGGKLQVHRCGADSRAGSVQAGLAAMQQAGAAASGVADEDWVLVHDAARPGITPALVSSLIAAVRLQLRAALEHGSPGQATGGDVCGGILALPVADSLKRARPAPVVAGESACIETSVARDGLWQAQTPQMFRHRQLRQALAAQLTEDRAAGGAGSITDEASAMERQGGRIALVPGALSNFKLTYASDLLLAELILRQTGY